MESLYTLRFVHLVSPRRRHRIRTAGEVARSNSRGDRHQQRSAAFSGVFGCYEFDSKASRSLRYAARPRIPLLTCATKPSVQLQARVHAAALRSAQRPPVRNNGQNTSTGQRPALDSPGFRWLIFQRRGSLRSAPPGPIVEPIITPNTPGEKAPPPTTAAP